MTGRALVGLTVLLVLGGCARQRILTALEAQGTTLKSYERPGGDEIHIIKTPDGYISKYRVYPWKRSSMQIAPHYRYERLYTIDPVVGVCRVGVSGDLIDCSKLKNDPDLRQYVK